MKLYYHPVSTTSRPIVHFAAESGLDLECQMVDLFAGEHRQPIYAAINPNCQVPMLEDGDFRLTECSAILKYLAEKTGSPAYPADLQRRARINERMDWFNTGLYRDLGYGLVYPQVLPHYKRPEPEVQAATLAWGCDKTRCWLKILDESLLGPRNDYLCGNDISIADYLGAAYLTLGEVIRLDYAAYSNVTRWIGNMKARPSWAKANEGFYAYFVAPFRDAPFVGI